MILGFDIETSSALEIGYGAWAYSLHPSTIVYCVAFAFAEEEHDYDYILWEPGLPWPKRVIDYIYSGGLVLAHNVGFEKSISKNILEGMGFPRIDVDQWVDTQAMGLEINLPMSLEGLAKSLGCKTQKDMDGAKTMLDMSKSIWDPMLKRYTYPYNTPENREILKKYCTIDVGSMLDSYFRMKEMPTNEKEIWRVDQIINERGVYLDKAFAIKCASVAKKRSAELSDEAFSITAGELLNSTSTPSLKKYLEAKNVTLPLVVRKTKKGFTKSPSAGKEAIIDLLKTDDLDDEVRALFNNRMEANKVTSLSKLDRVPKMVGPDGRLRFSLSYAGTTTNRWVAHGFQVQNMPKVKIKKHEFELIREILMQGSLDGLKMVSDKPLEAISQCLRSVISTPDGMELIAGDFTSIEARGIAWLANQNDKLDSFRSGVDTYILAALNVGAICSVHGTEFKKDECPECETHRQLGKVQELALGFGMGVVKFIDECASYGIRVEPKEARRIHTIWRKDNNRIVDFWADLEEAVKKAITNTKKIYRVRNLATWSTGLCLYIRMPSGDCIRYWRPRIKVVTKTIKIIDEHGNFKEFDMTGDEIQYFVTGKDKKNMYVDNLYGGKLADHVTQRLARDLLAQALVRIENTDPYNVVIHIHDSIAAEVPEGEGDVDEFCQLMSKLPEWASGMPIQVKGYRNKYFRG